jgi:hypothetical protein
MRPQTLAVLLGIAVAAAADELPLVTAVDYQPLAAPIRPQERAEAEKAYEFARQAYRRRLEESPR